jgi:hypothetical protein
MMSGPTDGVCEKHGKDQLSREKMLQNDAGDSYHDQKHTYGLIPCSLQRGFVCDRTEYLPLAEIKSLSVQK